PGATPREIRHLLGRWRWALASAALPRRGQCGRLQRHAALWALDALRPRGRHPALPYRRWMFPRCRAIWLQGNDLCEGRRRSLYREPKDIEEGHLHPEALG